MHNTLNNNKHKICYCKNKLVKSDRIKQGNVCRSCCQDMSRDELKYGCSKTDCFYRRIAIQPYYICVDCYNNDFNSDNKYDLDDNYRKNFHYMRRFYHKFLE